MKDKEEAQDEEFNAEAENESDVEDTIAEQETKETRRDYKAELTDLQQEGESMKCRFSSASLVKLSWLCRWPVQLLVEAIESLLY